MKQLIVQLFFILFTFPTFAQYTVKGGNGSPLQVVNSSKLEVYLLNGLADAEISFSSEDDQAHQWYKYDEKALDGVPVSCTQNGKTSTITGIEDGWGYFTGEATGPATHFIWIIDYSRYVPTFYSLSIDDNSDDRCQYLKLIADVEAKPLQYYTQTGTRMFLQRNYHLQYTTMEWDQNAKMFLDQPMDDLLNQAGEITVNAPLKDTDFTLTGDDYAAHFGISKMTRSPVYKAIAVKAIGLPEQHKEAGENEQEETGIIWGGSAPVDITFTAYANEPVAAHFIWKIDKMDPATGTPNTIVRYTGKVVEYNFEESGDYKVTLEVFDAHSTCSDTTQTFPVKIGETNLQVPNFFSPGSSIGSNDEFRVSYKSITSFKCSIFNRWGNLLYQWDNPAKGWDGRVGGRFVPTGVYFYVIEYRGSDGKKNVKSGNINILRSKDESR
jgi:gliding motility-associated-like protein